MTYSLPNWKDKPLASAQNIPISIPPKSIKIKGKSAIAVFVTAPHKKHTASIKAESSRKIPNQPSGSAKAKEMRN